MLQLDDMLVVTFGNKENNNEEVIAIKVEYSVSKQLYAEVCMTCIFLFLPRISYQVISYMSITYPHDHFSSKMESALTSHTDVRSYLVKSHIRQSQG